MTSIMVEELETVTEPNDLGDFFTGLALGIAIGMLICGGA